MDSITVSNYRCFGEEQTARLAPITLLVGENSSGKTSLAAMIRALWDVAYGERVPDFKEPPYDLGSFEEIVHHSHVGERENDDFEAAFELASGTPNRETGVSASSNIDRYKVEVTFGHQWGAPVPKRRRISQGEYWVEQRVEADGKIRYEFGTPRETVNLHDPELDRFFASNGGFDSLPPFEFMLHLLWRERPISKGKRRRARSGELTEEDADAIMRLLRSHVGVEMVGAHAAVSSRPFAGAPTRSHPRRTYDPASIAPDSEGDHVPMYLAQLSLRDSTAWSQLKSKLGKFGQEAGLFEEINVRHLGKTAGAPFQLEVRTSDSPPESQALNLADVGYGVSQVLPLVAELLRDDGPRMMLLQQPEVHLHPSAEAALGSLLCNVVSDDKHRTRRLIVETHSDFIIDRVRMAVTDRSLDFGPEDVSIVYFERRGSDVYLHSVAVDELGNLVNPPSGYRRFFMEESRRFLGI